MHIASIGIDLAKTTFHLVCIDLIEPPKRFCARFGPAHYYK